MNYIILTGIALTWLLTLIVYLTIRKDTALKTSHILLILSLILLPGALGFLMAGYEIVGVAFLVLSLILISWATKDIGRAGYTSKWLNIIGVISGTITLMLLIAQQLKIKVPYFGDIPSMFKKEIKKDFTIIPQKKETVQVETVTPVVETTPVCEIRQVTPKFDASTLLSQMRLSSTPSTSSKVSVTPSVSTPVPYISTPPQVPASLASLQQIIKSRSTTTPTVFDSSQI